jgi:Tetratricopeptide repeat
MPESNTSSLVDAEMDCLERTFQSREARLGWAHPQTVEAAILLADELKEFCAHEKAEALYRQSLQVLEAGGRDEPEMFECRLKLSHILRWRVAAGELDKDSGLGEAEALNRGVVEAYERLLGPLDTATSTAVYSLARMLRTKRDFRAAEAALLKLLEQQEQFLGPDDPETLWTVHVLGSLFQDEKNDAGAKTHFQRAAEGRARVLGPEHELTKVSRAALEKTIAKMAPMKTAKRKLIKKDHA